MFRNAMPRYEILSPDAVAVLDKGWRRIVSEIGVQCAKPEADSVSQVTLRESCHLQTAAALFTSLITPAISVSTPSTASNSWS